MTRYEFVKSTIDSVIKAYYDPEPTPHENISNDFSSLCLAIEELEDRLGVAISIEETEFCRTPNDLINICYLRYNELLDMENGGLRMVGELFVNFKTHFDLAQLEKALPLYPINSHKLYVIYSNVLKTMESYILTTDQEVYRSVLIDNLSMWELFSGRPDCYADHAI